VSLSRRVACHPDVFFVDNCDALCTTYLMPLADSEISCQIQDWSTGGSLFLDYCNLLHHFAAYQKVSYVVVQLT